MTSLNSRDTNATLEPGRARSKEDQKTILVSYSVNPEDDAFMPYRVSMATTISPAGIQNLHLHNPSLALSIICLSETQYAAKDQRLLQKNKLPGWTGYDPTDVFKSRVEALVGHSNMTGLRLVDDKTLKSICLEDEDRSQRGKYRLIKLEETEDLRFKLDSETVSQTPEFRLDKPLEQLDS